MQQDDFGGGKGVYIVTLNATASPKFAEVKVAVGAYKLEKVGATLTRKVESKAGKYVAGAIALANPLDDKGKVKEDVLKEVEDLLKAKKDNLQISGTLSEDDKGNQTLTLAGVQPAESK